jgi:asparagine synthase (glutamine-hydrolysing)
MSIIFGMLKSDGDSVVEPELRHLAIATQKHAPDGSFVKACGRVGMGFQPYRTHQRLDLESQPVRDVSGNLLTFDGRLDNYKELCELLDLRSQEMPDSAIVLASFDRWGEMCFSRFTGDWAMALWSERERSLYLARDHAGTRTLYYDTSGGTALWSTYIETILARRSDRELDEAFIASYLVCEPLRDLTPYKNIHAVTPAHYIVIRGDNSRLKKPHWRWMAKSKVKYKTDEEYNQHFLSLFRRAVEHRSGPGAAVLAQLSGGMDSTAIVCMSDHIRLDQGARPEELIDTVSYYDDSEPNWDEKPYFTLVEESRGKRGVHIRTSALDRSFQPPPAEYLFPGADSRTPLAEDEVEERIGRGKYRAILSGLGGDELLGGPPNAVPELADYLISLQAGRFFRQSFRWSLEKRMPLIHMIAKTAKFSAEIYPRLPVTEKKMPPWISHDLRARYLALKAGEARPLSLGLSPTAIDNGVTWWNMLETLPHRFHALTVRYEFRYPYLDRDLVDFLLRVPADQLLRPGRRRFMMRRALRHIVPSEVLERRRKAYVSRGPLALIPQNHETISQLFTNPLSASAGFIQRHEFSAALDQMATGSMSEWLGPMIRTINFELWFQTALLKRCAA